MLKADNQYDTTKLACGILEIKNHFNLIHSAVNGLTKQIKANANSTDPLETFLTHISDARRALNGIIISLLTDPIEPVEDLEEILEAA